MRKFSTFEYPSVLSFYSKITLHLLSEFRVFYLDDSTLGGCLEDVLHDMNTVKNFADELGLMEGIEALISTKIHFVEYYKKINCLKYMGSRLRHLQAHDSFGLLQNVFAIPKLVYSLRSSSYFSYSKPHEFDSLQ